MDYLFVRLLKSLGLLKKLNLSIKKRILGERVTIPLLGGIGVENLISSDFWMQHLLQYLGKIKKGSFIDIGVNMGQTLIKMRCLDKEAFYVGFEPNPQCVHYTQALIKANRFKNTFIVPVGLFNQNTVLQLNLYSELDTDQAASVIENFRPHDKIYSKINVPVFRFEDIHAILPEKLIAIIKIDVEGAELEVLQSMAQTILLYQPFVIIEILPCYSVDNKDRFERQQKIEDLLVQWNYSILQIHKNGKGIKRLELLKKIGIHSDTGLSDYVLAPHSLSDVLSTHFNN